MSSPTDARDDAALLAAHLAGDVEAFGVLFARHRDRLYAVALRTAGDPELAADALQDAMVSAFRRAATFRGDAAVTTWLHRVVVNAVLDLHRRNAVRATEPLPERGATERAGRPGQHGWPGSPGPGSAEDPEQSVIEGERRALLLDALRRLPAEQRAALVLVDVEGWSVAEAAGVLDCAPGTVKSRCSRGRSRLAELLRRPADTTAAAPAGRNPSDACRVPAPDPRTAGGQRPARQEGSP